MYALSRDLVAFFMNTAVLPKFNKIQTTFPKTTSTKFLWSGPCRIPISKLHTYRKDLNLTVFSYIGMVTSHNRFHVS